MRAKNHKMVKKQAEKMILDFMPALVEPLELERVRVNKKNRKHYKIDSKYKSNSVIYIVHNNNTEILDFI